MFLIKKIEDEYQSLSKIFKCSLKIENFLRALKKLNFNINYTFERRKILGKNYLKEIRNLYKLEKRHENVQRNFFFLCFSIIIFYPFFHDCELLFTGVFF